jgi:mono/diheme cytochrome c family protein
MKKLLILLVIAVLAAPAAAHADAMNENNAVSENNVKNDNSTKIDYDVKCSKCHRETKLLPKTAKSLGVDPGKLTLRTSKMNREEMIAIIAKGKDKMPGFEKELTKEQITDIVDYIIFLKKKSNVRSGSSSSTRLY